MNFLFWNVGNRDVRSAIVSVVESTQADILILAEYAGHEDTLVKALYAVGISYSAVPQIACTRLIVFSRFSISCFSHKRESGRYSILEFSEVGYETFLLGLVHLPSKLYMSSTDQLQEAQFFKRDIELVEAEVNHTRTIVVGDFNMNPFDPGMIAATAMHSIPCLKTARLESRIISGRKHSFFYNPTWNLFGDFDRIPGTYFHSSPSYESFYWNMLDQVIMRPSIAEQLDQQSLRIISRATELNLLNERGHPSVSDHLPIFFSVNLQS